MTLVGTTTVNIENSAFHDCPCFGSDLFSVRARGQILVSASGANFQQQFNLGVWSRCRIQPKFSIFTVCLCFSSQGALACLPL